MHIRKPLADTVKGQALSYPIVTTPRLETVQAYLLLSLWGTCVDGVRQSSCSKADHLCCRGYGRRDEHDHGWLMSNLGARMALDMHLYRWTGSKSCNVERTWLLTFIIDRTKSAQRGRVRSIHQRCDEQISRAYVWLQDHPECLLLVFYAVRICGFPYIRSGCSIYNLFNFLGQELINITGRCLDLLSSLPQGSGDFDTITSVYNGQAETWLHRYKETTATIKSNVKIAPAALQYMIYLGDFYVNCELSSQQLLESHEAELLFPIPEDWCLAVMSFALQHAMDGSTSDLGYCKDASLNLSTNRLRTIFTDLTQTTLRATRVLAATASEMTQESPVRMAPDGHFEFVLHAAVSV